MAVVDVVKFDSTPEIFAWKYPREDLGTWTQLIVHETQEAILFKGGAALDVFGPGRHTLNTENIPLLNKVVNLPFGGRSPFTAEVWFVNKVHSLDIKWGTSTPIQLQDPKYGIFAPVRSFGQFGVKIEDSKKFLLKLVGTLPTFDKTSLLQFFRGLYLTKVKDSISSYLVHKQIGILEINAYLDELSEHMRERIQPVLDEYGISLVNFYINDISVPDDDPAVVKLKEALAKRAEMDIIGYNYQQERSFDTMEGAATNPGSLGAGVMGAGLGFGMGMPLGGAIGQMMNSMAGNMTVSSSSSHTVSCARCKTQVPVDKRFCPDCGHDMQSTDKQQAIKCSKCGAALSPTVKFCPECGDKYNPCPNCGMDVMEDAAVCSACGYTMPRPCSHCGALVAQGGKFCAECGTSLVRKCPGCGQEINGNPKFCPDCGQQL